MAYIRNFFPKRFNQYVFQPSVGSSVGLITIWNGSLFTGRLISKSYYQITIELTSNHDNSKWYLTNVYWPNSDESKTEFSNWFTNLDSSDMELWLGMGDFNYIRGPDNRNRTGGDHDDIMIFNTMIMAYDLVKIPFKGRVYTWSNMQEIPLLEKIDWIFSSPHWTTKYPNTMAVPMAKLSSDHVPINIQIGSNIPESEIFRFEEFWIDLEGFIEIVESHWNNNIHYSDSARNIVAKFKSIRRGLKSWSKNLSKLNKTIENCCFYIKLLDGIEDQRNLSAT